MKTMRKSCFTLVEILIAMGICVIGVVSIMVLFPIGANASRDAIMVGQSKDAAGMILNYCKYCVEEGKEDGFNALTGWTINDVATYSASAVPMLDSTRQVGDLAFDESDYDGNVDGHGPVSISTILDAGNCTVYQHEQRKIDPATGAETARKCDVYAVKFLTQGSGGDIDDSMSIVKMWITPVTLPDNVTRIPRLATVNLEVSWPAELPIECRQREVYSIDLFCPAN